MQGPSSPPELKGVIPNSFTHIFDFVKASQGVEFLVRCSYLEIYNEVVKYATVYIYLYIYCISDTKLTAVTSVNVSCDAQRPARGL